MNNQLVVVEQSQRSLMMPVMDMATAIERRNQMVEFVQKIMIDGQDFGTIPGTGGKPTLYKAGAEKLSTFFGLVKRFEIIERTEDWDKPFFYYLYRCQLYRGDVLIAEADGSCNSHESKYRYRKASRVCPHCGSDAIIKGRDEYGGGWLCYGKKGGCGAKFTDGDQSIEGQETGRVENPDVADQVNTLQKMAQKRALVAATLLAVNASEFFTQDVEDMIIIEGAEVIPPKSQQKHTAPQWADVEEVSYEQLTKEDNASGRPNVAPAKKTTAKTPNAPDWPLAGPAKDFCDAVLAITDYYQNQYQLWNVVGKTGNLKDEETFNAKLSVAIDHANAKEAGQQSMFADEQSDTGYTE